MAGWVSRKEMTSGAQPCGQSDLARKAAQGHTRLSPGMCAGFKAGTGNGHRLVNETSETVVYLEVGDRSLGDEGIYPDDDLKAVLLDGQWTFQHKDGTPY